MVDGMALGRDGQQTKTWSAPSNALVIFERTSAVQTPFVGFNPANEHFSANLRIDENGSTKGNIWSIIT